LRFFGECVPLHNQKRFAIFLRALYRQDWVVYAKPPFGGPEHVLHYLARYTHRVAISNHRLLSVSAAEVCFRWKDYAHHGRQRTLTLGSEEFLRRFVQHVLPRGFPRICYFGFLANPEEPACCHSAALCSTRLRLKKHRSSQSLRCGSARTAMDSCIWLSEWRPHNCSSPKRKGDICLIPPRRAIKPAFTACCIARLMEVCLRSEKWRYLSAVVVVLQRLLHPIAHPAEWARVTYKPHSLQQPNIKR
jgi:hypothetical protein